jgi:hypothetical protein
MSRPRGTLLLESFLLFAHIVRQVAVEIFVLANRKKSDSAGSFKKSVGHQPLIVLGFEFLYPNVSQGASFSVTAVGILENARLYFVEPRKNSRRGALSVAAVAWDLFGLPGS